MPAYFTTIRSGKKTKQKKIPGWEKRKAEHDAWLRKHNAHPDQLKGKKLRGVVTLPWEASGYVPRETKHYPSLSTGGFAPCTKKEPMVYSGERKLLGIATLHKSNMVPVFDEQDAKDIARMRRG
jgi:hypothetical protein